MAKITFITGGQRSGKSSFAMKLANEQSEVPVYLATARVWDDDFQHRILKHRSDRGNRWQTVEEEKFLSNHDFSGKTVVVDCITLWLTNFFYDSDYDVETSLAAAKKEWDKLVKQDCTFIVVSNELGMGVHPENEAARKFADLQGWMNQDIAKNADSVYLMVSGYPLKVK